MQILSRDGKSIGDRPESIIHDTPDTVDLFEVITKAFFLNQEERFRAGIYIGYEGREWIDQAALVIPPFDEEQNSP